MQKSKQHYLLQKQSNVPILGHKIILAGSEHLNVIYWVAQKSKPLQNHQILSKTVNEDRFFFSKSLSAKQN